MAELVVPDYCNILPQPSLHSSYDRIPPKIEEWLRNKFQIEDTRIIAHRQTDCSKYWSYLTPDSVPEEKLLIAVLWQHWVRPRWCIL